MAEPFLKAIRQDQYVMSAEDSRAIQRAADRFAATAIAIMERGAAKVRAEHRLQAVFNAPISSLIHAMHARCQPAVNRTAADDLIGYFIDSTAGVAAGVATGLSFHALGPLTDQAIATFQDVFRQTVRNHQLDNATTGKPTQ